MTMRTLILLLLLLPGLASAGTTYFNYGEKRGLGAEIHMQDNTTPTVTSGAGYTRVAGTCTVDPDNDPQFDQTTNVCELCYTTGPARRMLFLADFTAYRASGSGNTTGTFALGVSTDGPGVGDGDQVPGFEVDISWSNQNYGVAAGAQAMTRIAPNTCISILVDESNGNNVVVDNLSIILMEDLGI